MFIEKMDLLITYDPDRGRTFILHILFYIHVMPLASDSIC